MQRIAPLGVSCVVLLHAPARAPNQGHTDGPFSCFVCFFDRHLLCRQANDSCVCFSLASRYYCFLYAVRSRPLAPRCSRDKYAYLSNFRWYTGVLVDLSHVEVGDPVLPMRVFADLSFQNSYRATKLSIDLSRAFLFGLVVLHWQEAFSCDTP